MSGNSLSQRKAQLDKAEREHLEDVVAEMRERVEDNVRFQLTQADLDTRPSDDEMLDEETQQLVDAIELEAVDDTDWDEAFEEYVDGVGYTIVNRLAALRCMEVRDFIGEEVTVFKENGLTPAAETLVHEEFLLEDEAILAAYHNTCDELAAELEILFDRSTAYSLVDPDDDTLEELCGMLDEVPDDVWRADDVLGWVYEYYNTSQLSAVRERMRTGNFDAEDVAIANQFYTPHWVARLLTDNAIAKPYLAARGEYNTCIKKQHKLSPKDRRERNPEFDSSSSIYDLCTYLVPSRTDNSSKKKHPSEIEIFDPTCGSGHFLLYAFDILERIWRESTEVEPGKIPAKILEHNLYGIDIDMRACQLAAFNLYLKARHRAEREGEDSFKIPTVGIVCADNQIANTNKATEIIDDLSEKNNDFSVALEAILNDFQSKKGLGSLLDVKGSLQEEAIRDQTEISDWSGNMPSLSNWIDELHKEIKLNEDDQFLYQNLQSFLRTVMFLTKEYDAILMNPPYGGHRRMPKPVKKYVQDHYEYKPEYYTNFLEQGKELLKDDGRIGMLVPRSFMYKDSFEDVRTDLIKEDRQFDFDFLIEFGKGILDNATVRTVGTVLKKTNNVQDTGRFMQLSDIDPDEKEDVFSEIISNNSDCQWREYSVEVDEFRKIPGGMLTYWTPSKLRDLYTNDTIFDADHTNIDRDDIGSANKGIDTGKNARFVRYSWECSNTSENWRPYAKGGRRSWFYYPAHYRIFWDDGKEVQRHSGSTIRNKEYIGRQAVTWPMIKESGHRFAEFKSGGVSDNVGPCFYPDKESIPYLIGILNSTVYTGLMLAQTPERNWFLSDIAVLPYFNLSRENKKEIKSLSMEITNLVKQFESFQLNSNRYGNSLDRYENIDDFVAKRTDIIESILDKMNEKKTKIDQYIVEGLETNEAVLKQIEREIKVRYGKHDKIPYSNGDISVQLESFCQRLLSHLVRTAVTNSNDGIIPTHSGVKEGTELHDQIIKQIDELFKSSPTNVLSEIDSVIGDQPADVSPYPNVEYWIQEKFFKKHLSNFQNTPVIWELTSSRLVSDANKEGFKCLIDYNRIDPSLFDQIKNKYIEPRKAEVRERKTAMERRRSDESVSTSERAEATKKYDEYVSCLQQIDQFEKAIQNLAKKSPRDWSKNNQNRAEQLQSTVEKFRKKTEYRLSLLDELNDLKSNDWFEDTFSRTFFKTVDENREEWIDALEQLETACEAYSKPQTEQIEAHLYDLFPYFDQVAGSDHYSSNGILFMTYYFEREGQKYLDEDGEIDIKLDHKEADLLANLAKGLDEYKELAEDIRKSCNKIKKNIPSSWEVRAISEITTKGYLPNRKHGVIINITPLADAEIVPEIVDDKVI